MRRARSRHLAALAAAVLLLAPCVGATPGAAQSPPPRREQLLSGAVFVNGTRLGGADSLDVLDSLGAASAAPPAAVTSPTPSSSTAAEARFTSLADSLEWVAARGAADSAAGFRVVVSLIDRQVAVLDGRDTLRVAPAAVATGDTLAYGGRVWTFTTPRGRRVVRAKDANPLWTPPDWHYAEVARDYGLKLARLPATGAVTLSDGSRLIVRDGAAGILAPGSRTWVALPTDEEIVFDETLFIPPIGTANRRIVGELGRFRLDLGDGYLLHGTPDEATVGSKVTHGCVRLRDEDIAWLYAHVPVGTPVYIY